MLTMLTRGADCGHIKENYVVPCYHIMLTGYVDTGCSLWPHPRRGGWRIKAGAGIIKWGWRWRGGLTLPQCQPSIIIKIRPRTFISCIAAEKIHYNVIIIQIMCASLPTFCCRNTTEKQNLKVNMLTDLCLEKEGTCEVCTSVMNELAIVVPPLDNMYEVPMNPMLDFRYIYLQKQLFSFPFWIIYRNSFMLYYILYSSFQSVFPYNIL